MFMVKFETQYFDYEREFYNKKENAVKRAFEIYEEQIDYETNKYYDGNRKEMIANCFGTEEEYNKVIEQIKAGDYDDDWVTILEIKTED